MTNIKRRKKERYNFLIDKQVYDDFSLLCDRLGLVRSKNIENHMIEFIDKNKELLNRIKNDQ